MTLIDTETAARAIDRTPRTIRRWVKAGRLANHGKGNAIRVDLYELISVSDAEGADVR